MRILGLALTGGLVVTSSLGAHAAPLGSNMARLATGAAPGIVQAWGGCGWGWHPGARTLEPVERRMGSTALRAEPLPRGLEPLWWRARSLRRMALRRRVGRLVQGLGWVRWRLIIHSHDVPTIAAGFFSSGWPQFGFCRVAQRHRRVRLVSNLRRRIECACRAR